MAQSRLRLNEILKAICPNVYFQPPENIQMQYPCIVYQREDVDIDRANNLPYRDHKRYSVTVIDRNPDSDIPDKMLDFPMCSFNRFYTANGLNHDVYVLYF
jgi:hypothetical protein